MRTLTSSGSVSTISIGGEKSSLPPTRRPPTPERRSATAKSHRGAARLDVDELPANWLDEDFEISLITLIGRRFRRLQYTRFDLLLGSIVSQFGHSADLAISSGLALVAVTAQYILRRMRQLDGSGPEWIHRRISRLKARMERLLGRLRVEALAAWLYPKVDMDGDGSVDRVELHCMCLQLYSKVTQFMPQVLTPPSKAHTDRLFAAFDIDDSGRIERAEWELLASVLFESLALRIAAQSAISLVLAPLAAAFAVAHAGKLQLGVSVAEVARACVPSSLRPLMQAVGTEGAAVTALAGVTIALLVPFTVSLVDEFYLLKASAKAKRALKAARSRDLARQQRWLGFLGGESGGESLGTLFSATNGTRWAALAAWARR
jgi:hypothetical protein